MEAQLSVAYLAAQSNCIGGAIPLESARREMSAGFQPVTTN
jgi:hypothetical protein